MTPWTHATTYPGAPHEYVLQADVPDVFAHFKFLIRDQGIEEQFTLRGRTATYRYYYAGDGHKYWIVGPVLNRCKTPAG